MTRNSKSKSKRMYRIFEEKDGLPHTLFRGVNGSRKLELDKWLISETRLVRDGSRERAKSYISGFHVLCNLDDIINFSSRFRIKKNRVISAIEVDMDAGTWIKPTNDKVILVKKMRINTKDWNERISI